MGKKILHHILQNRQIADFCPLLFTKAILEWETNATNKIRVYLYYGVFLGFLIAQLGLFINRSLEFKLEGINAKNHREFQKIEKYGTSRRTQEKHVSKRRRCRMSNVPELKKHDGLGIMRVYVNKKRNPNYCACY